MSETAIAPPQEQSQTEGPSAMQRLEQDFGNPETPPVKTEEKPAEPPAEVKTEPAKTEPKPEAKTEPAKAETKTEEKPVEPPVLDEWSAEEASAETPESETWKPMFEDFGIEVPQDYSEEKGYDHFKQGIESRIEQAKAFGIYDSISELPDAQKAEAKLIVDVMKSGQTLDQYFEPINRIKELKSMSPEALVRFTLSKVEGMTDEVLDHKMEELKKDGKLDLEYKAVMLGVNSAEKQLHLDRQNQIQKITAQNEQIREHKRQAELASFQAALDRKTTFMDRKLNDAVKKVVLQEYQNFDTIMKSPEKRVEFMLWNKYGKQGVEYLMARATEKATTEKQKDDLNIPPAIGGGTRVDATHHDTGIDRLSADTRYSEKG